MKISLFPRMPQHVQVNALLCMTDGEQSLDFGTPYYFQAPPDPRVPLFPEHVTFRPPMIRPVGFEIWISAVAFTSPSASWGPTLAGPSDTCSLLSLDVEDRRRPEAPVVLDTTLPPVQHRIVVSLVMTSTQRRHLESSPSVTLF